MEDIIHYTSNDYEGMACAILSTYIFGNSIKIIHCDKKASCKITKHKQIFITGIDCNTDEDPSLVHCKGKYFFNEFLKKIKMSFPEYFINNSALDTFIEHSKAYIDWSWNTKQLYYGKNLDELSKLYGRDATIMSTANRISTVDHIVSDQEKEILKFEKYRMNQYIDSKEIEIMLVGKFRYGIVYADQYVAEISNWLLKKHKVDVAVVINMSNKIATYKYNKSNKNMLGFNKKLENIGANITNNGGIVKFKSTFDKSIFLSLVGNIK